jgi:hypothetical protein
MFFKFKAITIKIFYSFLQHVFQILVIINFNQVDVKSLVDNIIFLVSVCTFLPKERVVLFEMMFCQFEHVDKRVV